MEIGTDKEADIAGEKLLPEHAGTAPAVVPQPNAVDEKLLPAISPNLLDAPEIQKEVVVVTPATPEIKEDKKIDGSLTAVESSLYLGNAITEAQNKLAQKTPAPATKRAVDDFPVSSPVPAGRGAREIGLEETPIREKPEVIPVASIKRGGEPTVGAPRVRTYANDISAVMRQRNSTLTSIVSAEQKRSLDEEPREDESAVRSRTLRSRIFLIGAIIFILIGVGSITTAIILNKPPSVASQHQTLIPVNHSAMVDYAEGDVLPTNLAKEKDSASLNLGEVEEFHVTRNSVPVSSSDILTALGAPNELIRNTTDVMVGTHAFDHNQPFLLISVSAYDRAFAAMLSWETRMDEGLGDFFKPESLAPSSITSTPPPLTFTDRAIQNIDVRESQPAWHILYAFVQPNLILITTNESTLREITTRLSLQKTSN